MIVVVHSLRLCQAHRTYQSLLSILFVNRPNDFYFVAIFDLQILPFVQVLSANLFSCLRVGTLND